MFYERDHIGVTVSMTVLSRILICNLGVITHGSPHGLKTKGCTNKRRGFKVRSDGCK